MEKGLTVISDEQKNLLKQTICKGATDAELNMFLEICKATQLNPFKKEIWFIKNVRTGDVQIMTGINGFLSIANNNPLFDGMEVSVEEKDGKPFSSTAKVYRKDRKYPSVATVYLQEYFRPSTTGRGMWEKMPRTMLQKVAKSVALREAFPQELNGLYSEEELPREYGTPVADVVVDAMIESKSEYYYDINILDEDKREKAKEYASSMGAEIKANIVKSTTPLSKLKRCEVDSPEMLSEEAIADAFEARLEEDAQCQQR